MRDNEYVANERINLGSTTLITISKDRKKLRNIKLPPIIISTGSLVKSIIEPASHEMILFDFNFWRVFLIA